MITADYIETRAQVTLSPEDIGYGILRQAYITKQPHRGMISQFPDQLFKVVDVNSWEQAGVLKTTFNLEMVPS